jgi:cytochrome bd-type quinol oxidase subunit 2
MSNFKTIFYRFLQLAPLFLILPFPAYAQNMEFADNAATIGDFNSVFASILRALIGLVGIASLAMLILGGFKFISAGADKDASQKAQQTITYAVGGLIISLSAWIILSIIGTFLGVNLGVFDICITAGC